MSKIATKEIKFVSSEVKCSLRHNRWKDGQNNIRIDPH